MIKRYLIIGIGAYLAIGAGVMALTIAKIYPGIPLSCPEVNIYDYPCIDFFPFYLEEAKSAPFWFSGVLLWPYYLLILVLYWR